MRRRSITSAYYLYVISQDIPYVDPNSYVDLGLTSGTKWATCNVGASTPEEFGINYQFPTDEEIQSVVGKNWRLPSPSEIEELCSECSCQMYILNGVNGQKLTGPNGNSIFLPANQMPEIFSGRYWSNDSNWRMRTEADYCGLSPVYTVPYTYLANHVVRPVLI